MITAQQELHNRVQSNVDRAIAEMAVRAERKATAKELAGPNPMAHHGAEVSNGGMAGMLEMVMRVNSLSKAKHKAGHYLQCARFCRFMGDARGVTFNLNMVAVWRKEVQVRAEFERNK